MCKFQNEFSSFQGSKAYSARTKDLEYCNAKEEY